MHTVSIECSNGITCMSWAVGRKSENPGRTHADKRRRYKPYTKKAKDGIESVTFLM